MRRIPRQSPTARALGAHRTSVQPLCRWRQTTPSSSTTSWTTSPPRLTHSMTFSPIPHSSVAPRCPIASLAPYWLAINRKIENNDCAIGTLTCGDRWWSRLGSNQRPSACEADALPLSHGTGAERRTTSKTSMCNGFAQNALTASGQQEICAAKLGWTIVVLRDGRRCRSWRADVAQLVAHHLAKVRVAGSNPVVRSKVQVASIPAVEWPSGEATACKAVHTGSIPVSTSV